MKKSERAQPKIAEFPIARLFPNIITIIAICFGFTSIKYSLNEQWDMAVTFIIIAGFLDLVDGRLARYLKATSNFGAQLDTLADFINFGVAPALTVYLWKLSQIEVNGLGWVFALIFVICAAVRLARFNTEAIEEGKPEWKNGFFVGVPSPGGAGLAIIPLMLSFETSLMNSLNPYFLGIYLVVIGMMMSSRIPTFSSKKLIIKRENIPLVLVVSGLIISAITIKPWYFIPFFGLIYLGSIPFSIIFFKKMSSAKY